MDKQAPSICFESRCGCDPWMAPSVVIPPLLAPPVPCLVAACETRKYGNIMRARAAANRLWLTGRKSTFKTGITFWKVEEPVVTLTAVLKSGLQECCMGDYSGVLLC